MAVTWSSHDDFFNSFIVDGVIAHAIKCSLIHYFDNNLFAQTRNMIMENIGLLKFRLCFFFPFVIHQTNNQTEKKGFNGLIGIDVLHKRL